MGTETIAKDGKTSKLIQARARRSHWCGDEWNGMSIGNGLRELYDLSYVRFMAPSIYLVTFCTWERLELNLAARQVVMEACQYFHGKRYAIFAGVIMPDHVHLLIQPWLKDSATFWTIGSILHSIKGFSGKQIPSVMPHIGKLWQDGRHERLVVGDRHFQSAMKYIYQNPIVAQIVEPLETYPYCWSNSPIEPSASVSLAANQ